MLPDYHSHKQLGGESTYESMWTVGWLMRSARALHFAFGLLTWKRKLHKQQTVVTKYGKVLLEGRREQRLAYVSEITQHFKDGQKHKMGIYFKKLQSDWQYAPEPSAL